MRPQEASQLEYRQISPATVTLAMTGLLAIGPGQVSAQTLELYGLEHVSLDAVDTGVESVYQLASNSSRLGLRGSRIVSDALELVYQLEMGVDLSFDGENNDGNGPVRDDRVLFSKTRPSHLGLASDFGTVLYGHTDALDQWANEFNPFADQIGDLGNLWAGSGLPGRMDDVVQYRSPGALPASLVVSYKPDDAGDPEALIVKGGYRFDSWHLGLTHAAFETAAARDHSAQALVAYYVDDRFSVGAGVQREGDIGGVPGNDRSSVYVAGTRRLGERTQLRAMLANSLAQESDGDALQWSLGLDYLYNSRVTFYGSVAGMQNGDAASFSVNGKGHGGAVTPLPGDDPFAISFGLVTRFDFSILD